MTERRCDTCEFWVRNCGDDEDAHVDDMKGKCHRLPPRPTMGDFEYEALKHLSTIAWQSADEEQQHLEFFGWEEAIFEQVTWPVTTASDWCGEWRVTTR